MAFGIFRPWFGAGRRNDRRSVATLEAPSGDAAAPPRDPLLRADGLRLRAIAKKTAGVVLNEVTGVAQRRFIGTPECDAIDPFLLFEWFEAGSAGQKVGEAADQPLLGFELVTYVVSGRIRHWDNLGFAGTIPEGGVQWLTASGGLIRGEAAEREAGRLSGFRLWLNLPAAKKRSEPAHYPEPGSNQLPVENRAGVRLKVIAGTTSMGLTGLFLDQATEPLIMDATLDQGAFLEETLSKRRKVILFVYAGEVGLPAAAAEGITVVGAGELAVLTEGDVLALTAGAGGAGLILLAARPLGEPIARSGPIVMNSRAELLAGIRDYRARIF